MDLILNFHVIDPKNIGDLLSSPIEYFPFPNCETVKIDIREAENFAQNYRHYVQDYDRYDRIHLIIGGGGLLFSRFLHQFKALKHFKQSQEAQKRKVSLIAWGIGQQIYEHDAEKISTYQNFSYQDYLNSFEKVGIRDFGCERQAMVWVPCASCMHPGFDRPRQCQHEVVVFSHKKFQIHVDRVPRMTNESQNFDQILDFLGSGETILTSSYHGAYWGTLLGRKVLAFPFSSKFYFLKHQPGIYPIQKWKHRTQSVKILGKSLYEFRSKNQLITDITAWRDFLKEAKSYRDSLSECRDRNQWYYSQMLDLLGN